MLVYTQLSWKNIFFEKSYSSLFFWGKLALDKSDAPKMLFVLRMVCSYFKKIYTIIIIFRHRYVEQKIRAESVKLLKIDEEKKRAN